MSFRNTLYEVLGSSWPVSKGHGRWVTLLHDTLRIHPYGRFKYKPVGQYRLRLDPADPNDRSYYFSVRISSHERLMAQLLRPGDCVLDIGANVGYFSAVCARLVTERGAVHAIEASPILVERLRECLAECPGGPIRLHHFAIWNTAMIIPFNLATVSGWSSLKQNPTFQTERVIEVPAITLDEFMRREALDHARVIKMDIEGAEVDALRGAKDVLGLQRADFFLLEAENNRLRAFGHRGEEIAEIMAANRYEPICIIESDRIQPVTQARSIPGRFNGDYLYVRQDYLADVRERIF